MEIHLKYIVLFVGIIAMFFASIPKHRFRFGLETAWLIIFLFLAIRYDFGNDYLPYKDIFDEINSFSHFSIDKEAHVEPGWQILCRVFGPLGFSAMVAVLTAFECFVFYRFIKNYVPERYYWLSIFIFVFNPSLMLVGASMMRNEVAIALFVWGIDYIKDRKFLRYIITIYIATQFHSSAIVLYMLYVFAYIKDLNTKRSMYIFIIIAYMVLIFASSRLGGIIEDVAMLADEEDALDFYSMDAPITETSVGIGTFVTYLQFVYIVFSMYRYQANIRLLFCMLMIGTFVRPFAFVLPAVGRFSSYFSIFTVACYPIIAGYCKKSSMPNVNVEKQLGFNLRQLVDVIMISLTAVVILYDFMGFFTNPTWVNKFSEYHTVFDIN